MDLTWKENGQQEKRKPTKHRNKTNQGSKLCLVFKIKTKEIPDVNPDNVNKECDYKVTQYF